MTVIPDFSDDWAVWINNGGGITPGVLMGMTGRAEA